MRQASERYLETPEPADTGAEREQGRRTRLRRPEPNRIAESPSKASPERAQFPPFADKDTLVREHGRAVVS